MANAKNVKYQVLVVVPAYNEELVVVEETVAHLVEVFVSMPALSFCIAVVNDGSDPQYRLDELKKNSKVHYLSHQMNKGYGAAIKTAILQIPAEYIAICDADGTYPIDAFPELLEGIENFDMVIGTRTGSVRQIPWTRRFPKFVLNWFASYFANMRICDLNSGMRVFRSDLAFHLWGLIPNGFSLTSTLTMGALLGGFRVREVPINYFNRKGSSSIRPFHDTIRFFRLVVRLGITFAPKRLFSPIAWILILAGLGKGLLRDLWITGQLGNLSILLLLTGVQIYLMGIVAHVVILSRGISPRGNLRSLRPD